VKKFHVGDTPMDVLAAKAAGVVPVGVTTGVFSAEDLLSACPEAILHTSLEGEDALKTFGLL
jgi:phosphoglycolate phosphatase-like HAD superfamily hydrolase